jgi:hypothetical protein
MSILGPVQAAFDLGGHADTSGPDHALHRMTLRQPRKIAQHAPPVDPSMFQLIVVVVVFLKSKTAFCLTLLTSRPAGF